ncbi:LptE family protein [Carboxylicivirga mesophila]|uniref:LptE family protein n=1 Tax=Carboxylicivirga mesophila TaxID=1166478 RepID=A0ABS5K615_9BACT|nr:LptE family protein [Carboxylicivirga mesophila]MBS2210415.1 LptE family protein [Carboxylicivirga mesophila]
MKIAYSIIGMVLALMVTACSINMTMSGASIPENINSFSVQYFDNRAPLINPVLSQNFTEGLKDRISNESRLNLVNGTGDVDFSGEITGYSVRPMAIQADAISAETRLSMTIKVRYKNYKDPKLNWESSFSAFRDFPSDQNINAVENDLTTEMIEEITENIFNKAFADW